MGAWLSEDPWFFEWVGMPLLIFCARILDVSLGTSRVMFIMAGNRRVATLLGFFESLVWLLAIGQIFQNVSNPMSYLAYAGGFATGTYVGMKIEARLAYGQVVLRIITRRDAKELIAHFKATSERYTAVEAHNQAGEEVHVLFLAIARKRLPQMLERIKAHNPNAFYTVETARQVSHPELPMPVIAEKKPFCFLARERMQM